MLSITPRDVEDLRLMLIDRFQLAFNRSLEETESEVEDFDTMVARLQKAREDLKLIWNDLTDDKEDLADALYDELQALRRYFCAPLVRPITEDKMPYISPAINTLVSLNFLDESIPLFAQLLHCVICGLELRLTQSQDPNKALAHLLKLMEIGERLEDSEEDGEELWDTFSQIHNLIFPCLEVSSQAETARLCSLIYCKMAYLLQLIPCNRIWIRELLAPGILASAEYLIFKQAADENTALQVLVAIGQIQGVQLAPHQRILLNRAYTAAEELYGS